MEKNYKEYWMDDKMKRYLKGNITVTLTRPVISDYNRAMLWFYVTGSQRLNQDGFIAGFKEKAGKNLFLVIKYIDGNDCY